jgi:glutamate-1-semialdehyde 2,1-aminomutase
MMRLGQRLADGLVSLGEAAGIAVEVTGPVCMPTVTIRDDPDYVQMRRFACEMVARGSFVHPLHNWFVSIAHTDADIDETLDHEAGRRDP